MTRLLALAGRLCAWFAADRDRVVFVGVVALGALVFFMGWPEVRA